jgi:Rps23 Pro-64 3,4-dihydroxylase Tpa1-like proline 4-hydroxylase
MKFINMTVDELHRLAKRKSEEYKTADPFPNIYFDNFFNDERLSEILNEFPDMSKKPDLKFEDTNQIKLASKGEYRFGDETKEFMHFLNSQPFLEFLSTLTGIDALIPDPYFDGGGCHQIMPGGLLKIHADFNKNKLTNLDRRLNVLVYLNKDWHEEWGGYFELWDTEMKHSIKKILPVFNRMAIFTTTDFSYHGHPDALKCPPERSRKSLALYYYTNGRPASEVNSGLESHSTLFKARPRTDKSRISVKEIVKQITPPILYNAAKKITK